MGKELYTDYNTELIRRYINGEEECFSLLVENNMDLVDRAVEKFYISRLYDINDFKQELYCSLCRLIKRWLMESKAHGLRGYITRGLEYDSSRLNRIASKGLSTSSLRGVIYRFDFEDYLLRQDMSMNMSNLLKNILSEKEYSVICMHYGLSGQNENTLSEIEKALNIPNQCARGIEIKALKKIRGNFEFMNRFGHIERKDKYYISYCLDVSSR